MSEEFKVKIGAELNSTSFDSIKNQLKSFCQNKNNKITLSLNDRQVKSQLRQIENQIKNLSKIKINLNANENNRGRNNNNNNRNNNYNRNSFGIKDNLNLSKYDSQLATLESKFNKITVKSKEITNSLASVNRELRNMHSASNSGDLNKLVKSHYNFQRALEKTKNLINIQSKAEEKIKNDTNLNLDKKNFSLKIDNWMKDNSKAVSMFSARLEKLKAELKSCDNVRLGQLKKEFMEIDKQAQLSGVKKKTFKDRFKDSLHTLSTYFSSYMVISQSIKALTSMYNEVVKVDSAMTELKKVTDESNSTYKNFLSNVGKDAQNIGTTVSGLISSTADFARLGYGFKQSQELAKVANIYAVVGDEVEGVDGATQSLVSTMAAFNGEVEAMSVVDKMNEVGNKFAISSGGIGEALRRSASSMKAANNTIDETIALITGANTVVQDPAVIGTAFKTISMRIRGAKTELEEAGLETDGMVESTSKLREEIIAISGVDIMSDKNTFKSTYRIMDELSKKWKDLSDIQQATITELIAGKRHGNIISSLMENFDTTRNALKASLDSDGSAMKEHEKYMDSIEARVNQLKASWENLSVTFLDTGLVKGFVGFIKAIVDGVTLLIDKFGVLGTVLGGLSFVGLAKNKFNISSSFVNLAKAIGLSTTALGGFLAVVGLIGGIAIAIDVATESFAEAKEKAEESRSAYKETADEVDSLSSRLNDVKSRMSELNSMDSITVTEKEELQKLQAENDALERQLAIKQKLANYQLGVSAKDANHVLTKESSWETDEYKKNNKGDYVYGSYGVRLKEWETGDIIDKTYYQQEELNKKKLEQFKIEKELSELDVKKSKFWQEKTPYEKKLKEYENVKKEIESLEKEVGTNIDEINTHYSSLFDADGTIVKGYEETAKRVEGLLDFYNSDPNVNLSEQEKAFKKLEGFFDGSTGKNFVYEELLNASKQAKLTADDIVKMGIAIDDVDASHIADYFNEIAEKAQEANESVKGIDGSVDGVKKAFEQSNQDQDWIDMAEAMGKATELYKSGKVGTDDFQSATQFLTYDKINPDAEEFKYDADAYVKYWEEASKKAKRYFDKENPLQSVTNFTNDLVNKGFATKNGDEFNWTKQFKNTAVAAKELGISVEAVESLIHNLESYGFEFDDVMFSAEGLDRYKTALENIRSVYDKLDNNASKGNLGNMIKNWDNEITQYEADMTKLTEDKIVHIEFIYDLATIQSQIDELTSKQIGQGGQNIETNSEILAGNKKYINTAKQGTQYENTSVEVQAKLKVTDDEIEKLYSELAKTDAVNDKSKFIKLQAEIQNKQELQKSLLTAFSETHPEINVDSSIEDIQGAWNDFFSKPQTLYVNAELSDTEIESQLNNLSAGSKIIFDADVNSDGIKEEINAIKNEDGTISFTANVNGVVQEVQAVKNENGTISYTLGDYPTEVPNAQQQVDRKPNNSEVNVNPKGVQQQAKRYASNPSSLFSNLPTIFQKVKRIFSGKSDLNGTAHANGTAYDSGTINDTSFLKKRWETKKDETALTGEVGQEIVVHGNEWWTVGDDGAEFTYIPKGSIVFDDKQTKELLSTGRINSRGRSYLGGSAYANGGRLPSGGSSSSSSSSSSKNNKSKSNKNNSPNSSSDSKEAKEFKETLDWIEIAIKRIERVISKLNSKATNIYKTWSERNNALSEQIVKISEKIELQQKGYEKYIKKANSIGLSSDLVNKVQSGTLDIETITDEELSKKINEYKEWYEKALDCADAIEDLKEKESELYEQRFNNILTKFDSVITEFDNQKSILEEFINQSTAKGLLTSEKYYTALKKNESNNIVELEKEKAELLASLQKSLEDGKITKGSEAWSKMCNEIDNVNLAIEQSNTALLEYDKTIRELKWEQFDLLQEKIESVTKESDFLIELMSKDKLFDDKGLLSNKGMATIGLHGQNYNVYMEQSKKYSEELSKIESEIAKDPYNQDLIKRKEKLLELQRESILAAEDEKEAIVDLIKDGIDKQLDSLQKLIDKYKDALDSQKDLYDYKNQIEDKTSEINSLKKQLSAYAGDDSEESKSIKQKLETSLKEAEKDLKETEYDKYISDQKELLDSLYTEYETILNSRLDNVDKLISEVITEVNESSSVISNTLVEQAEKVGINLSQEMRDIWLNGDGSVKNILTTYNNGVATTVTTISNTLNTISNYVSNLIAQSNKDAETNMSKPTSKPTSQSPQANTNPKPVPKPPVNPTPTPPPKPAGKTEQQKYGVALAIWNGGYGWGSGNSRKNKLISKGFDYNEIQGILNKVAGDVRNGRWVGKYFGIRDLSPYHYNRFKHGSKKIKKNQLAWMNENNNMETIIRPSDGALLTPVAQNDSILKSSATSNIFSFANNPEEFIRNLIGDKTTSSLPPIISNNNTHNGDINMQFDLKDVTNYEEFKYALQHDKNFEKMVRAMTTDRIFGKSSLRKYNV